MGKKALLPGTLSHFYDLKNYSESSAFLPDLNLEVGSPGMKCVTNIRTINKFSSQ